MYIYIVKVLPATNSKCTRLKAISASGKSVTTSYDYSIGSIDNIVACVRKLCELINDDIDKLTIDYNEHYKSYIVVNY